MKTKQTKTTSDVAGLFRKTEHDCPLVPSVGPTSVAFANLYKKI